MAICSPALALFGIIISAWGIIQLAIMGFCYQIRSVALSEDLPLTTSTDESAHAFLSEADKGYTTNSYNCYIAALLYLVTLAFSCHQFYMNNRSAVSM